MGGREFDKERVREYNGTKLIKLRMYERGGVSVKTDYKKLCIELFGTDDVGKLREIAAGIKVGNSRNPRNAGRKRKFSEGDVAEMERLRSEGKGVGEIAERFGTSRQVIGRYLLPRPAIGYSLRVTLMFKQHPCTVIDVDFLEKRIFTRNMTDDIYHRAFGKKEDPDWGDFEDFLRYRCFSESRGNCREILTDLGLTDYDPLQIVEKTQGRISDDDMWLRFHYYSRRKVLNG